MLRKQRKWSWPVFVFFLGIIFCCSESAHSAFYHRRLCLPQVEGVGTYWAYCTSDNMHYCECARGFNPGTMESKKRSHCNSTLANAQKVEKRKIKRTVRPNVEAEPVYNLPHTLAGEWEDVVGYVGFQFKNKTDN